MKGSVMVGANSIGWIPKDKAHLFINLFNQIVDELGSTNKALKQIGTGWSSVDRIKNKNITNALAKKILLTHKAMFKKKVK